MSEENKTNYELLVDSIWNEIEQEYGGGYCLQTCELVIALLEGRGIDI